MGWKATGQPTVRKQRDKWVVRVDGIDTETGKHRPRQLGTYALAALGADRRSVGLGAGAGGHSGHGEVAGAALRRVALGRDVEGAGAVRVGDPAHRGRPRRDPPRPARPGGRRRLARRPGGGWRPVVAVDPDLSHRAAGCVWPTRSRKACCGEVPPLACRCRVRSPSRRRQKEVDAWTEEQVARFLVGQSPTIAGPSPSASACSTACADPRRWRCGGTTSTPPAGTLRIDEGLVAVSKGAVWTEAKNARSRRVIPLDDETMRALARRRTATGRGAACSPVATWEDHDLITTTHVGRPVMPRSLDRALELLVSRRPGCPGSPPTVFATRRRRTWSAAPTTSASSERWPTCSATPPTCS